VNVCYFNILFVAHSLSQNYTYFNVTHILDIIHRLVFIKDTIFRKLPLLPSSGIIIKSVYLLDGAIIYQN
jgi:hypothetical protein